jgi:hypothetical protein
VSLLVSTQEGAAGQAWRWPRSRKSAGRRRVRVAVGRSVVVGIAGASL